MKDTTLVTKDSGGTKPLRLSAFKFKKLSELFPDLFSTAPKGTGIKRVAKGVYDFSVSGGAVGTFNLLPETDLIPANAIVTRALIDVVTAPTSGGSATVAVKVKNANDIKTATAIASYTVGLMDGVPVDTAATSIKLTAASNIVMTVATAALTAGKIVVFLEYVISE